MKRSDFYKFLPSEAIIMSQVELYWMEMVGHYLWGVLFIIKVDNNKDGHPDNLVFNYYIDCALYCA